MTHIYRNTSPSGNYDLLIISLVHQSAGMLYYMAENIKKYVEGKIIWIVHYNNADPIDENKLPDWVWIVRDIQSTDRCSFSLLFAIQTTLDFAIKNGVKFTNVLTLSSGSAFFRTFKTPIHETISLTSHNRKFNPNANLMHEEPIDIQYAGRCGQHLINSGSSSWQYDMNTSGADKDEFLQSFMKKRNFTKFLGAQWSGQIWPYTVAQMLAEDIGFIRKNIVTNPSKNIYACEEIYLSTYAYNYALRNNLQVGHVEVIIDW